VDVLIDDLKIGDNFGVRLSAADALKKITGQDFYVSQKKWLEWRKRYRSKKTE